MKKIFLLMFGLGLTLAVQAQEEVVDAYFTTDEMPDMMIFMPGPPDSTSVAFANDVNRYYWGKEMREDPERADHLQNPSGTGHDGARRYLPLPPGAGCACSEY